MSFEILLVFLLIVFLLIALYREWFWPPVCFFIVIIVLTLSGILSPKEALSGFANDQLAVIVMLLVLSGIVRQSSLLGKLFNRIFRGATTEKSFLFRMMGYVSVSSAVFNNTPLVAMMMPYVYEWGKKNNVSSSRLLIPLSYAAILGGCVTLVGTSTNLIVNGMAIDAGLGSLGIFDFVAVGLPMLIIGLVYILFFGRALLPERKDIIDRYVESSREYLVEAEIKKKSNLIGKTILDAGLRQLEGLFLIEIVRGENIITPVAPTEVLLENDTLVFSGVTTAINDLTNPTMGLSLPKACNISSSKKGIVEVVVSYNSRLIGQKIQDSDFRGKYDGSILAVHRNRENLSGKIGEIEIKAGDVLLVLVGNDFYKRVTGQPFYFISKEQELRDLNPIKIAVIVLGIVAALILQAVGLVSLFNGLFLLLGIVLLMNVIPVTEIRKEMDFNLIGLLALGLAFGKGMINSGAADFIAKGMLEMILPFGKVGIITVLFLLTNLLSSYITNKAAVAIVFPIAISIAQVLGHDTTPYVLVVCFGAAASFITPIGYQTNLMVYGPGRYSFGDFFRIGLPLTILYLITCVIVLTYFI